MNKLYNIRMRSSNNEQHISGAERIVSYERINRTVSEMIERSFHHTRGQPDFTSVKIEEIKEPIKMIEPITEEIEVENSFHNTLETLKTVLKPLTLSDELVTRMYETVNSKENLSGAILIDLHTGKRLDNKVNGIRVSRFDWSLKAHEWFIENNPKAYSERQLDAFALASKVQASNVAVELCCSDDPNYTTGYLAFNNMYIRIPNMKKMNTFNGGRVFVIDSTKYCVEETIDFLENQSVLLEGEFM